MERPLDPVLLETMKDIQVPGSVPWWPPAAGWWMLGIMVLLLIAVIILQWRTRSALRRAALAEMGVIREQFRNHGDGGRLALELSMLLRRVALGSHGAKQPGGLIGEDWLRFLDATGDCDRFSNGEGRELVIAPYTGHLSCDGAVLLQLVDHWIRRNT